MYLGVMKFATAMTLIFAASTANVGAQVTCQDVNDAVRKVVDDYASQLGEVQDRLNNVVSSKSGMGKTEKLTFEVAIPSFVFFTDSVPLSFPNIISQPVKITAQLPEVVIEERVCGQVPEFNGFTVKWKSINCSVPTSSYSLVDTTVMVPRVYWASENRLVSIPVLNSVERRGYTLDIPQASENAPVMTEIKSDIAELANLAGSTRTEYSSYLEKQVIDAYNCSSRLISENIDPALARIANLQLNAPQAVAPEFREAFLVKVNEINGSDFSERAQRYENDMRRGVARITAKLETEKAKALTALKKD